MLGSDLVLVWFGFGSGTARSGLCLVGVDRVAKEYNCAISV